MQAVPVQAAPSVLLIVLLVVAIGLIAVFLAFKRTRPVGAALLGAAGLAGVVVLAYLGRGFPLVQQASTASPEFVVGESFPEVEHRYTAQEAFSARGWQGWSRLRVMAIGVGVALLIAGALVGRGTSSESRWVTFGARIGLALGVAAVGLVALMLLAHRSHSAAGPIITARAVRPWPGALRTIPEQQFPSPPPAPVPPPGSVPPVVPSETQVATATPAPTPPVEAPKPGDAEAKASETPAAPAAATAPATEAEKPAEKSAEKPIDSVAEKPAEKPAESASSARASPGATVPAEAVPEPAPAWIHERPRLDGEVYRCVVKSGPFVTLDECRRALSRAIAREADAYVDLWKGEGTAQAVMLDMAYLSSRVVKATHVEDVESKSVGTMRQIHARLEFDGQVRREIESRLHDRAVQGRLHWLGSVVGLVLGVLGTAFGYLRADLATGGAYRQRLRLVAAGALLLVLGGVMLVQ